MPGFYSTGAPSRRAPAVGPTCRPILQLKALSLAAPGLSLAAPQQRARSSALDGNRSSAA
eukprot:6492000-Alexandrium_andersonii.AAC.1